jgi:hypothetical protein
MSCHVTQSAVTLPTAQTQTEPRSEGSPLLSSAEQSRFRLRVRCDCSRPTRRQTGADGQNLGRSANVADFADRDTQQRSASAASFIGPAIWRRRARRSGLLTTQSRRQSALVASGL